MARDGKVTGRHDIVATLREHAGKCILENRKLKNHHRDWLGGGDFFLRLERATDTVNHAPSKQPHPGAPPSPAGLVLVK